MAKRKSPLANKAAREGEPMKYEVAESKSKKMAPWKGMKKGADCAKR